MGIPDFGLGGREHARRQFEKLANADFYDLAKQSGLMCNWLVLSITLPSCHHSFVIADFLF